MGTETHFTFLLRFQFVCLKTPLKLEHLILIAKFLLIIKNQLKVWLDIFEREIHWVKTSIVLFAL